MKKRALMFAILIVIAIITLSLTIILAQTEPTTTDDPIDKAYTCLEGKVDGKCSTLNLEQQIFSSLALQYDSGILSECKDLILSNANTNADNKQQCWPKTNCNIKTTAQSILALDASNVDTKVAEAWLNNQTTTPTNLDWLLEIESNEATTCSISYGPTYTGIVIGADRKISGNTGSCLSLDTGGYWLKINQNCYDKEFTISCDKSFITTLLYRKTGLSTIHVSEAVHSSSSGGDTSEKINSVCFGTRGVCDYEGSLWATAVLDIKGNDISAHLPYLISEASANNRLIPNSFLFLLTGYTEYYDSLISQRKSGLWDESGNKLYDSALSMLSLQNINIPEVDTAKEKLLALQSTDGCWQGNVRDTAFVLYSVWPRFTTTTNPNPDPDTPVDCEGEGGGFCMSTLRCSEISGTNLGYECPSGISICCNKNDIGTCEEEGGRICNSNANEICTGTTIPSIDVEGLQVGQTCCIGLCEESTPNANDCYENNDDGVCRSGGCGDDEVNTGDLCEFSSEFCCVPSTTPTPTTGGKPWYKNFWIWFFIILIILIIIGIINRKKLNVMINNFRNKGKGTPPNRPTGPGGFGPSMAGPRPGFPPGRPFGGPPPRRLFSRPILPPGSAQPRPRTPVKALPITKKSSSSSKSPSKDKDYEDVMEKLKKISK